MREIKEERNHPMDMKLHDQDISGCFEDRAGKLGLCRKRFQETVAKTAALYHQTLAQKLPLLQLVYDTESLGIIKETAATIRHRYQELVVLGIGGSTLNPQALLGLCPYQELQATRVHFIDTIDPHTIEGLLAHLDLSQTAFLATSKSGATVETLAQTLLCLTVLKEKGIKDMGERFFTITDPVPNPLRTLMQEIGATVLDHPPAIGGRYSTLTHVGLLPAAVAGLDIDAVVQGARVFLDAAHSSDGGAAAEGAALSWLMMEKGVNITVMMPYINRLEPFTIWFRQIWAESLGKHGKGSTPITAIGTLDQHSQVQLYLDGPKDKLFTFITLSEFTSQYRLEYPITQGSIRYLQHKSLGNINAASQEATAETMIRNGCPLRQIILHGMDEFSLGALMMHFMLETILTAGLLGVNAFDQPAVEQGKALARKILGS